MGKQLNYSMAIGGSETVGYATAEILSKLSPVGMKSIPFGDEIFAPLLMDSLLQYRSLGLC